ncbi:MAG TPA: hypothetical protein VJU78_20170 [Chitinophagaceae bacterium]|nr:hypothetical protein [Chitinophagaceae bacterium]
MKKRIISSQTIDKDAPLYTEKGYIARNLFGFIIVVMLLLITLVNQP